jgi:hypothetical protein
MDGIKVKLTKFSNWLSDSGHSMQEQEKIYDDMLEDVLANPRWYLDQLSYLPEFRVSWINYAKQNVTKPYRYSKPRRKGALKSKPL